MMADLAYMLKGYVFLYSNMSTPLARRALFIKIWYFVININSGFKRIL
jgi:hypothetical protein